MFDYRIFYPQLGIADQQRNRRPAPSGPSDRIFRLTGDRKPSRPAARR
jgi:hypothetical protein